ncbi:MAG: trigger factor [Clostridia bacterium]|nr:trigger factor [Clostridia bacterium]
MSVKIEKTENNNEVKLNFTVEAKEFEKSMNKVFKQNAKYFSIPGFRKGKAPMNIVEKFYGSEIFYEDAFNDVFANVYEEAIKENNIEVVTRPNVDVKVMEKGKDLEFVVTVGIKPEVKLGKYKGVEIEKVEYKVTEKDIEEELSKMQERNARLVSVTDRAVETGDTTVIDFEGFCNGEAFDGGKAENHELVIGSNTFIPGFEDQVIGMKIDEEKDINVKFPDEYFSKDLAGKDAIFKVKLHEIKVKELPKLDDEFAKDVSEFDTLAELKDDLKNKKEESNNEKAKNEMEESAVNAAVDCSEVEISDGMIEIELDNMVQDMDRRLSYQGIKFEQYLKMIGKTMADFRKESTETATKSIKMRLVLEAVYEDSKLEVSEEEIKNRVAELVATYGRKEEDITSNEELMKQLKNGIQTEKAVKFLVDNAKVVAKKENSKKDKEEKTEKADK